MTVTEAAACGTPAVVTDIAGHRDAVQSGVTGVLSARHGRARARHRTRARRSRHASADERSRALARAASSRGRRPRRARSPRSPARRLDSDAPGAPADARPLARALPAHRPCPRRVRPAAAHPPRRGRRGHQDLPLPRPWPPARQGALHVGLGHRARHGHPPDPRLPVPDGPVLLAHADPRASPTGSRSASGSARSCSPPARACCSSCARWAGSAVEPTLARGMVVAAAVYMLSPYVLDYAARISVILLPWAALPWLIGMAMRAGTRGRMAVAGVVRGRDRARRRRQRHRAPLRGHRPGALARLRDVRHEGDRRCGGRLAAIGRIGALTLGVSLWWIAGLWAQGKYGIPILRYTETYETVREGLERARGAAGPRLLVLLRRRQARPVDRAERRVHPAPLADRGRLPPRDRRAARRRRAAVEAAGLLRRAPRVGHADRGRRAPLRRSVALRIDLLEVRPHGPRARAAIDAPGGAAHRPVARGAARCRHARARPVAADRSASLPRSPRSPSR